MSRRIPQTLISSSTGSISEQNTPPPKSTQPPIIVIDKFVLLRFEEVSIYKIDEVITGVRLLLTNERIAIAQEEIGIFFQNIFNFKNISISSNEITFCFIPFIKICIRGRVSPSLASVWNTINESVTASIKKLYCSYSQQKFEPIEYETRVIRSLQKYYRQSDEERLYFDLMQRMSIVDILGAKKEITSSYCNLAPNNPTTEERAYNAVINTFHNPSQTSLVYRRTNESIILRRGIINTPEQRIFEDNIVKQYISGMDLKKTDNNKKIIPFLFIPSNTNKSEKMPNNAQYNNYHVVKVPCEDIISCLSTRNAGHYINNMDQHVVEYTSAFKAIIKTALHIVLLSHCKCTVVIIEDNELLDLSFLLSPLSKLMMDSYYTTIPGFIFLIRREFINYHYNFTSIFDLSDDDDTYDRRRLNSYFLFLMTVRYFLFVMPSAFEFSDSFIEAIMGYSCSCMQFPFFVPSHFEGHETTQHPVFYCAHPWESYQLRHKFDEDVLNSLYNDRDYYQTKPNKEKKTILSEYFFSSSLSYDLLSIHTDIFNACLFQQWIYICAKRIPLGATVYYSSADDIHTSEEISDTTKPIYKYLYRFLNLKVSVFSELALRPDGVSDFSKITAKEYYY